MSIYKLHDQGVELGPTMKELQPLVRMGPVTYIVSRDFKYCTLITHTCYQICIRIIQLLYFILISYQALFSIFKVHV